MTTESPADQKSGDITDQPVPALVENSDEAEFYEECKRSLRERNRNTTTKWSLWFYILVFIVIGVPVWWKTTTPERWNLPDVSVLTARTEQFRHHYKISIVFFDRDENFSKIKQLFASSSSSGEQEASNNNSLVFVNEFVVRNAFERELTALEKWNSSLIDELDDHLAQLSPHSNNNLLFYVLPRTVRAGFRTHSGKHRSIFIDLNELSSPEDLFAAVVDHVQQTQELSMKFYENLDKNDQNNLLMLGREFEFVFDVLFEDEHSFWRNKNPQQMAADRALINARIERTVASIVKRFYTGRHHFSSIFKINFVTQILHYVLPDSFIEKSLPKSAHNSTEKLLDFSTVQSLLDHVESKRVDHSNEKSYHVIVVIASDGSTLKFVENGRTSILVTTPFRGAIMLDNGDNQAVLRAFHDFLCRFFQIENFQQQSLESIGRSIAHKQIVKTLQSLDATEKLLKKVSNIVIEKKIAQRMQRSFDSAIRAIDLLEHGGELSSILELSHSAYVQSEQAFYDPSLLSLLYFPEDQKYAIYLPLFLPICLPLLMSVVRNFQARSKASKTKVE